MNKLKGVVYQIIVAVPEKSLDFFFARMDEKGLVELIHPLNEVKNGYINDYKFIEISEKNMSVKDKLLNAINSLPINRLFYSCTPVLR